MSRDVLEYSSLDDPLKKWGNSVGKQPATDRVITTTANIVSAYISANAVPAGALADLIASVHASLKSLGSGVSASLPAPPKPAADVKGSVTADFIICLEDGKKFKSLKRHLKVHYGLTPEQYRAKWDLPPTYPMVAPNYAAVRSRLAKSIGLGRKPEPTKQSSRGQSSRGKARRSSKRGPARRGEELVGGE